MKRLLQFGLPAVAIGLILIVIALSYSPLRDITTAPEPAVASLPPADDQTSVLRLPVSIAYADLAAYANQKIPQQLVNKREKKRYKTRLLGIPIEIEGRLKTRVTRSGPVRVSEHKGRLSILLPLNFRAEFKGDGTSDPDAVSKGAVNVRLRLTPGVTAQWQPTLKARASYQWRHKPTLKIGLLRLDARKILGNALQEKLDELTAELERDTQQSTGLRESVEQRWHEMHQVRELGSSESQAWLSVDPQAAYFMPPRFTADAMVLEFALAAKLSTLIGDVQPPPQAEPLPDLMLTSPPGTGIRLKLPVMLNYEGMTQSLRQRYLGQQLTLEHGQVELLDFRLYSAGETLVLGTKIKTESSGHLLNSQGWLYLQGKPHYDSATQQLRMEDFRFTRQVDNPLLSSASWILQDSLREQLAAGLIYDLSDRLSKAKTALNDRINRPIGDGLVMSGQLDKLQLSRIQPRSQDLLLLLDAEGEIAISSSLNPAAAASQSDAKPTANNPATGLPAP